ncbi:MAG: hypothetical protein IKT24_05495, partial [Clostridia bacterium]|nr:hypothetical protein [Clostridia bacterium]
LEQAYRNSLLTGRYPACVLWLEIRPGSVDVNVDSSPRYPSRFVLEIDPDDLEYTSPVREELIKDAREYIAAANTYLFGAKPPALFSVGDRVKHPIMGEGAVAAVDTDAGAYLIAFDTVATPRNISFRAKLEKA